MLLCREVCEQLYESLRRPFWEIGERATESSSVAKALKQDDVIDGEGEKRIRFGGEVGNSIFDRGINDGASVEFVGDSRVVAFEEVLIDAVVLIEEPEG